MNDIPLNTIRSELVDIATGFLKNPKISSEQMERKREFLKKKGLTDTEINYAFQLIPQQEIISTYRPSFLRRFLNDLAFAGFLVFVIRIIKQFFRSNQLNETIKNLQKSVENIQKNIVKLHQTADQLNLSMQTSKPNQSSSIEEIKREIQGLKELFSGCPRVPSWQSKTTKTITSSDNDEIIVISEQDK